MAQHEAGLRTLLLQPLFKHQHIFTCCHSFIVSPFYPPAGLPRSAGVHNVLPHEHCHEGPDELAKWCSSSVACPVNACDHVVEADGVLPGPCSVCGCRLCINCAQPIHELKAGFRADARACERHHPCVGGCGSICEWVRQGEKPPVALFLIQRTVCPFLTT